MDDHARPGAADHGELDHDDELDVGDQDRAEVMAQPGADTIKAAQLAEMIAAMSRFMARLADAPAVRQTELGLAEWLSLRHIADVADQRPGMLAQKQGVTRQRINQIVKSLKAAGLVQTTAVDGVKGTTLSATQDGRAKSQEMDVAMTALLADRFDGKPANVTLLTRKLTRLGKGMKPVPAQGTGPGRDDAAIAPADATETHDSADDQPGGRMKHAGKGKLAGRGKAGQGKLGQGKAAGARTPGGAQQRKARLAARAAET